MIRKLYRELILFNMVNICIESEIQRFKLEGLRNSRMTKERSGMIGKRRRRALRKAIGIF